MPTKPHKASDYLDTPEAIAAYLNVVFEDPGSDHEDLMIALRNVAEAIGGVSELARRTGLNRAGLSRALATRTTPRIDTVHKILKASGVRLQFASGAARSPTLPG